VADFDSKAQISLEYQQYLKALDSLIQANQKFGKSVGLTGQQIAGFEKRLNGAKASLTGVAAEQRRATAEQKKATEEQRKANAEQKKAEQQGALYTKYLEQQAAGMARKAAATDKAAASAGRAEAKERKLSGALAEQIERIRTLNQQTRALSDSRKAIRGNLAANLSGIPENGPSPRVGATFGNIVSQSDKATQQASRSYLNLSTSIDGTIDARQRESQAFSSSLQARLQQTAATDKATEATDKATASNGNLESQLIRGRYALFDVAQAYASVAAATLGAVSATAIFATQYETAFTEIERTTLSITGEVSGNINNLRQDFLTLAETIPLSFAELTKIGALGAQLGIDESGLVAFTETVAQFSRVSGVSAEETALAFGRVGQLLGVTSDEYVNLGSAIAAVAVSSAATDAQVISLTKELAAGASGAGFTADAVVGLSSALASLGVAPERARGALSTYFGTLNKAVAEGGQSLADFATVTGISADELERLVRNGEGEKVLEGFIEGLSRLDDVDTTVALDRLNLSQLRVADTFRRLGQNVEFVAEQFGISRQAFAEGTFLGDAYAIVLDDVASQFQLLLNSVAGFLATAGLPFLEFLRVSLPLVAGFFTALTEFVSTDFGVGVVKFVTVLLVLVGVLAATRAAAALTAASIFAISTASTILGGTGVVATLGAITTALLGTNTAAVTLKTSFALLSKVFAGLAIAGFAVDGLTNDFNGLKEVAVFVLEALGGVLDVFVTLADGIADSNIEILNWSYSIQKAIPELRTLMEIIQAVAFAAFDAADKFARMFDAAGRSETANRIRGRNGDTTGKRGKLGIAPILTDDNFDFAYFERLALGVDNSASSFDDLSSSIGGVDSAATEAAKEVRTLVDYAGDLSKVFSRSFDLRFKSQLAVDGIANTWEALTDRIREARLETDKLTADKAIKEYFLSVADAYGDELRAGVLRGEIADINEKLTETQSDASKELDGNSKAARNNRSTITGLVKQYQEYISALAESGADQATLNAAVARSEIEFSQQARALGFSNAQLQPYIASFRDMTTIIDKVPRNITVSVNVDPALQALAELAALADRAGAAARNAAGSFGGIRLPSEQDSKGIRQAALAATILAQAAYVNQLRLSGNISGAIKVVDLLNASRNNMTNGTYASGGFTGRGGKYEPAGVVHRGEYVVPKSQVNQSTGMPNANALGGQMPASRGPSYAGGGMVTGRGMGAGMMVELSPIDRKLLAAAGNVSLSIDGRVISGTVARNNTVDALRGTN